MRKLKRRDEITPSHISRKWQDQEPNQAGWAPGLCPLTSVPLVESPAEWGGQGVGCGLFAAAPTSQGLFVHLSLKAWCPQDSV